MPSRISFAFVALAAAGLAALLVAYRPLWSGLTILGLVLAGGAAVTMRRFRFSALRSEAIAIELALLPFALALRVERYRLVIAVLLCLLVLAIRGTRGRGATPPWTRLIGICALLAIVFVPLVSRPYVLNQVLVTVLTVVILVFAAFRRSFDRVVASLVDGIGVYLIANVVGHAVGMQSPDVGIRTGGLGSSFGGERIFYPFATGVGYPPIMAAMFVAGGLLVFEKNLLRRWFRLAALAAALLVLIEANARASLGIAAVILVSTLIFPKFLAVAAPFVGVFSLFLAFVFNAVQGRILAPVITTATQLVPALSRGSGSSASDVSLDGRDVIWLQAINYWNHNVSFAKALLGWGSSGQTTSGAYTSYSSQVAGITSDVQIISVHNSMLQELYDGGLIGVLAFTVLIVWGIIRMTAMAVQGTKFALVGVAVCTAGLMAGSTEVAMAPGYSQESLWVVVGIVLSSIISTSVANVSVSPVKDVQVSEHSKTDEVSYSN